MHADNAPAVLESAIRDAVARDSFAEAAALLHRYAACVEWQLQSIAPGSDNALALRLNTEALFDWTKAMASASRAKSAAQIARLRFAGAYRDGRPFSPRT